jgi:hypothetical protein
VSKQKKILILCSNEVDVLSTVVGRGFFLEPGILYGGLRRNLLQCCLKKLNLLSTFFHILCSRNLDSDPEPDSQKARIWTRI